MAARQKRRRVEQPDDSEGGQQATLLTPRFACPYFQREPHKYNNATYRSCCGPGWLNVHRLKGHLYRSHRKLCCFRCWKGFSSEAELKAHTQSLTPCQMQENTSVPEGFNQEQEVRLRSRKNLPQSEEQRWREVYQILFPDDEAIPEPFESPTPTADGAYAPGNPSDTSEILKWSIDAFEEQLKVELAPLHSSVRKRIRHVLPQVVRRALLFSLPPPPPLPPSLSKHLKTQASADDSDEIQYLGQRKVPDPPKHTGRAARPSPPATKTPQRSTSADSDGEPRRPSSPVEPPRSAAGPSASSSSSSSSKPGRQPLPTTTVRFKDSSYVPTAGNVEDWFDFFSIERPASSTQFAQSSLEVLADQAEVLSKAAKPGSQVPTPPSEPARRDSVSSGPQVRSLPDLHGRVVSRSSGRFNEPWADGFF